jgi:uncharacterized protein
LADGRGRVYRSVYHLCIYQRIYSGMDFDWDDNNLDHIARHGVEPEEAEEAVLDEEAKSVSIYNRSSEWRQGIIGKVGTRILFVILTTRYKQIGEGDFINF